MVGGGRWERAVSVLCVCVCAMPATCCHKVILFDMTARAKGAAQANELKCRRLTGWRHSAPDLVSLRVKWRKAALSGGRGDVMLAHRVGVN